VLQLTCGNPSTSLQHCCPAAIQDLAQEEYGEYVFQGNRKPFPLKHASISVEDSIFSSVMQ